MSTLDSFCRSDDSPTLRAKVQQAYDLLASGVRRGIVPQESFDMLMTAKVLHLRQLEKAGALP